MHLLQWQTIGCNVVEGCTSELAMRAICLAPMFPRHVLPPFQLMSADGDTAQRPLVVKESFHEAHERIWQMVYIPYDLTKP